MTRIHERQTESRVADIALQTPHQGPGRRVAPFEVTGLLSWEKRRPGQAAIRAFHGKDPIGRIFNRAGHSMTDKDAHALEILGQAVSGAVHHIRHVREAGARACAARWEGGAA